MFCRYLRPLLLSIVTLTGFALADAVSYEALSTGGAVMRDQQLREIRDVMRGGRGGYVDLGFNYLPLRSQTPLESPYGEHEGYAFKHHFAGFGSGEVAKNSHLGLLLWFERSGWDGEDFFFWPMYNDFSLARSVTTWGFTYTQTTLNLTLAGGMQHQNVEYVGDIYPHENDSLLYSWGHIRLGRTSVQGSFYRGHWNTVRVSLDLESRSVYGGRSHGPLTYLPNLEMALYNGKGDKDSIRVFWEQNLYAQVLYGEVSFDFPRKEFHSGALKYYPDPSRMVAIEATCLRRNVRPGSKDLLWGGGIELPFVRFAYNSSYDYETFFHAKGTFLVEFQFNLATIDGLLFARGGTRSAPMETLKIEKKKNFEDKDSKSFDLMKGVKEEPKTLDAKGIRYEKSGSEGGK
ncbi:MAG: hypothetical protein IKS02_06035 [Fibrobacter sp.]|nr:hypothetical protein [Fibrobacter sp.]